RLARQHPCQPNPGLLTAGQFVDALVEPVADVRLSRGRFNYLRVFIPPGQPAQSDDIANLQRPGDPATLGQKAQLPGLFVITEFAAGTAIVTDLASTMFDA